MIIIRVLNLGAVVQSTTIAIMAQMNYEARMAGNPWPYPEVGEVAVAVFADTGDEPWAVYRHLVWLALRCTSFPILVRSIHPKRNRILSKLFPSTGVAKASRVTRFLAWLRRIEIGTLRGSLKSSVNWKIDCVERTIRRDVVGLKPRQRIPAGVHIEQIFGLSFDEPSRVRKTRARFAIAIPWASERCPLFDMEQTRGGCLTWLKKYGPPYKV